MNHWRRRIPVPLLAFAWIVALATSGSRARAGDEVAPVERATAAPVLFLPGSEGNVPVWLVSPVLPQPLEALEQEAGRTAIAEGGSLPGAPDSRWTFVNAGRDPLQPARSAPSADLPSPAVTDGVIYAFTTLWLGPARRTMLLANADSPFRIFAGGETRESRPMRTARGEVQTVFLPLREPGEEIRVLIRLEARPGSSLLLAMRDKPTADGRIGAPLTDARAVLNLLPRADPASLYPVRKAISAEASVRETVTASASPRFLDGQTKIRLELACDPTGWPVDLPLTLRVTGRSGDTETLLTTREVTPAELAGMPLALDLALQTPPATGRLHLSAQMLAFGAEVASAADDVFDETALLARLKEIEQQATQLHTSQNATPGEAEQTVAALVQLGREQMNLLRENRQRRTLFYGQKLDEILTRMEGALAAVQAERDPLAGKTGAIEGAYISAIDGSVQPYRYYVPPAAPNKNPAEADDNALPMVVMLHGYVPSYNKLSWIEIDEPMQRCFDELGAVLLWPFGRSCTDFLTIGEVDVLAAIDEVAKHVPIDRSRVYLAGYSMGGSGVWTMLLHHPDRFAAAQVWSGRTDWYHWHEEKLSAAGFTRETLPFWKRWLIDADNPYTFAENLRTIPIRAIHPLDDTLVKPGHTTRIYEKLKPPHGRMRMETPSGGMGHWHFSRELSDPESYRCMLEQRSDDPQRAQTVSAAAATTKEIAPDLLGNKSGSRLTGPVKDAFCGPFLLVVGTSGSEAETAANRANAQQFVKDWEAWAHGSPRIQDDTALTEDDVKRYHLWCFGTPSTNAYLAKLGERLPYRFDNGQYSVGDRSVPQSRPASAHPPGSNAQKLAAQVAGDPTGFVGVCPNPETGSTYVVVLDGLYYGRSLSFNHKWDLVPDYIVFTDRTDVYDGTNTALLAGFLDSDWQFDPELAWPPIK